MELPLLVVALLMVPLLIAPILLTLPAATHQAIIAADWFIWATMAPFT